MAKAYIGLGSNLGNREQYLRTALEQIKADDSIIITNVSSVYETDPIGVIDQPSFLNMVIEVKTTYAPIELLERLQSIENVCGRKRELKWGPRTLDLDILLYNQENMKSERLEIPHPRMKERGFVLIPLHEINAQLVETRFSKEYEEVIKQSKHGVKQWKQKNEMNSIAFLEK